LLCPRNGLFFFLEQRPVDDANRIRLKQTVSRAAIAAIVCALALGLAAQEGPEQPTDSKVSVPPKNNPPPRSDQDNSTTNEGEYSSSKTYKIDISPPSGEASTPDDSGDVNELKPWNPHKALKAIEVGDFYRKRKKYAAAESRYREALQWKPNDAIASFRLAQTLEKMGRGDEAISYYRAYLKIIPEGEFAEDSHKGITRLSKTARK
jgi:tetratricopeptide (TPR) repeat protein